MAQMIGLINKDMQTVLNNILHMFKKVVGNVIRKAMKDFFFKKD